MFLYKQGKLCLEQAGTYLALQDFACRQNQAFYLYDLDGFRDWYRFCKKNLPEKTKIFFSVKANNHPGILQTLQEEGSGLDIVSGGEMELGKRQGFSPSRMIFSGVAKTKEELSQALDLPILQINVESFEELKRIDALSKDLKKPARLGLRINPNVNFETHPYIKTGLTGHKFGIDEEDIPLILDYISKNKQLHLQGLSQHIGSQIRDISALRQAWQNLKSHFENLSKDGFPLKNLDLGGGLGVDYSQASREADQKLFLSYSSLLKELFSDFPAEIYLEPGRMLVARFGLLCTRVEYVKKSKQKTFAIVNTGMHHFLRPSLYQSFHRIEQLELAQKGSCELYDVVGPICETGDVLGKDVELTSLRASSWLAIRDVGAYGEVMSNNYNLQKPARSFAFSKGNPWIPLST